MTEQQILALSGRELDAAVASFMGWEDVRRQRHPTGPRIGPPWFEEEEDAWDWWGTYVTVPPNKMRAQVEPYSTDRNACALVEAEIERRGLADRYAAELEVMVNPLYLVRGDKASWRLITASPESRCRAALLAARDQP